MEYGIIASRADLTGAVFHLYIAHLIVFVFNQTVGTLIQLLFIFSIRRSSHKLFKRLME
jgi:hypothetical protein